MNCSNQRMTFIDVPYCVVIKQTKRIRCYHGKDKRRCRDCNGSAFCIHDKDKRYCRECGGSALCIHDKQKAQCRKCGGSSYCIHDKQKYRCRECGGASFCIHDKRKDKCRECSGASFCIHDKQKYRCRECGGIGVCIHNKLKSQCRECGGSTFCIHDKQKKQCRECGGSTFCIHDKKKAHCRDCGGSALCIHDKQKAYCRECHGSGFCIHDKQKAQCRECGGSIFCIHDKQKSLCKPCGGSRVCKTEFCETVKNPKYNGYCTRCYAYTFPDEPLVRNFKTKELTVVDYITAKYPHYTWVNDKRISGGCSQRRPDLLLDMGYKIVIIEVDENRHDSYTTECETARLNEISTDLGYRPIVMIRFNPDGYTTADNVKVTSPWAVNGTTKLYSVKKTKMAEWNTRLERLTAALDYHVNTENTELITIDELYY